MFHVKQRALAVGRFKRVTRTSASEKLCRCRARARRRGRQAGRFPPLRGFPAERLCEGGEG